jgi:hypothetical protein
LGAGLRMLARRQAAEVLGVDGTGEPELFG